MGAFGRWRNTGAETDALGAAQLEEEKDHRNALIQTTYDKLYPLWTMLGVSDQEMEDFVNQWMGSTSDVVNAVRLSSHPLPPT